MEPSFLVRTSTLASPNFSGNRVYQEFRYSFEAANPAVRSVPLAVRAQ
jgi:hypothetical protein